MADASWYYAGVDEGGFAAYDDIKARARGLELTEFERQFPVPALLVVYYEPEESDRPLDASSQGGVQLLTMSIKSAAILHYLNRIAFLCKRPGNPYAHLVSIGRSAANDIAIAVDSVSKVHGYFALDDERWYFTDHGSTNGSFLNDEPLQAGQKYSLGDGDLLQLGLEVTLEYFSPARLYERATRRR